MIDATCAMIGVAENATAEAQEQTDNSGHDYNDAQFRVEHCSVDIGFDFERRELACHAKYTLSFNGWRRRRHEEEETLLYPTAIDALLDTESRIESILINGQPCTTFSHKNTTTYQQWSNSLDFGNIKTLHEQSNKSICNPNWDEVGLLNIALEPSLDAFIEDIDNGSKMESCSGAEETTSEPLPKQTVQLDIHYTCCKGIHWSSSPSSEGGSRIYQVYSVPGMQRSWLPTLHHTTNNQQKCAQTLMNHHPWTLRYYILHEDNKRSYECLSTGIAQEATKSSPTSQKKRPAEFTFNAPALPATEMAFALSPTLTGLRVASAGFTQIYGHACDVEKLALATEFITRLFPFFHWYLTSGNVDVKEQQEGDEASNDADNSHSNGSSSNSLGFPHKSFSIVFLREFGGPEECFCAGNLLFVSSAALFDGSVVDQTLATRKLTAMAISQQYFRVGGASRAKEPGGGGGAWLTRGLGLYVGFEALRVFHGNNERLFRIQRSIDRLVYLEARLCPRPISLCGAGGGGAGIVREWFDLRAFLLMHSLECAVGGALPMAKIIGCFWSDLHHNAHHSSKQDAVDSQESLLLRACKRITGKDMTHWFQQWVHSPGLPLLQVTAQFHRKRSLLQIECKQSDYAAFDDEEEEEEEGKKKAGASRIFTGNLLLRVHEVDGVYDHCVRIDEAVHHFELPVHAKAKKLKKRKRLTSANINGDDQQQGIIAASELQEEEEEDTFTNPVSWIRVDPEMHWLASIEFFQPEHQLIDQLLTERSVTAQYQAIQALGRLRPSREPTIGALDKLLNDTRVYWECRVMAAQTLATCAPSPNTHQGGLRLLSFYSKQYSLHRPDSKIVPIPCANSFAAAVTDSSVSASASSGSAGASYCLQSGLAPSMSLVSTSNATVMELVGQVILNRLRYNDNSNNNTIDDGPLVAGIIHAFTQHLQQRQAVGVSTDRLAKEFVRELDRYTIVESIHPFYHNAVMCAVLDAWRGLFVMGIVSEAFVAGKLLGGLHNAPATGAGSPLSNSAAAVDGSGVGDGFLDCGDYVGVSIAAARLALHLTLFDSDRGRDDGAPSAPSTSPPSAPQLLANKSINDKLHNLLHTHQAPSIIKALSQSSAANHRHPQAKETSFKAALRRMIKEWILPMCCFRPFNNLLAVDAISLLEEWQEGSKGGKLYSVSRIPPTHASFVGERDAGDHAAASGDLPTKAPSLSLKLFIGSSSSSNKKDKNAAGSDNGDQRLLDDNDTVDGPECKVVAAGEEEEDNGSLPQFDAADATASSTIIAQIIAELWQHPDALPFTWPVQESSVPGYHRIIKRPMSLQSLRQKQAQYRSLDAFVEDLALIFANCYTFNQPSSPIYEQAERLYLWTAARLEEACSQHGCDVDWVHLKKVFESRTTVSSEINSAALNLQPNPNANVNNRPPKKGATKTPTDPMEAIMQALCKHQFAHWFMHPVDWKALCIPSYPDIIKQPMDLSTLRSQMPMSPSQFFTQAHLIFDNCARFNQAGTVVYQNGLAMKRVLERLQKIHFPHLSSPPPTTPQHRRDNGEDVAGKDDLDGGEGSAGDDDAQ